MRRDRNELRIATPIFRNHFLGGQLVFDAIWIGAFFIHFVDRNDQWHTGSPSMLNRFFGLWHDSVIRRNDQNHNIGRLCTASTHGGKRRVARCIEEGDHPHISLHVVSTNVLGNTARLADSNT